jgi:hypothetical protein
MMSGVSGAAKLLENTVFTMEDALKPAITYEQKSMYQTRLVWDMDLSAGLYSMADPEDYVHLALALLEV